MIDNYAKIVHDNLNRLYMHLPIDLAKRIPGEQDGERFIFNAFGEQCILSPKCITLGGNETSSVLGILITLYVLNVGSDVCIRLPLKAFKEIPDSMPYAGAFSTHTEQMLVPQVAQIKKLTQKITRSLNGEQGTSDMGGDFSFIVFPLPKIALGYIFYEADEDFPASVTCLYSNNAHLFMPVDGLADVGEYTSQKILKLID